MRCRDPSGEDQVPRSAPRVALPAVRTAGSTPNPPVLPWHLSHGTSPMAWLDEARGGCHGTQVVVRGPGRSRSPTAGVAGDERRVGHAGDRGERSGRPRGRADSRTADRVQPEGLRAEKCHVKPLSAVLTDRAIGLPVLRVGHLAHPPVGLHPLDQVSAVSARPVVGRVADRGVPGSRRAGRGVRGLGAGRPPTERRAR